MSKAKKRDTPPKNQSKIKSRVRELAEKEGIKSSYGLQKHLDVAPTVAVNLWNDDVTRFSVETLQLLCEKLMCEVGELLVYEPNARRSKPVSAPESVKGELVKETTEKTVKPSNGALVEFDNVASDNEKSFSTEQIAEILGLKLSSVREHYNSGKLLFFKVGKKNKVRESDLNDFIARRGKK
jgi:excisionase family DNA binding protein